MIIETPLYYKATDLQTERCQVDEVVKLNHWQFEYLKNCTLDDFDFIEELRDKLPLTNDNTRHCILALDESGGDGVLIDPQGYSYPRYSAFIPNARQMLEAEKYPSLTDFAKSMREMVETVTRLALGSHTDGVYASDLENLETGYLTKIIWDKFLLIDMLNERPEFESVEYEKGSVVMKLKDEYINDFAEEPESMDRDEDGGMIM